MKQFSKEQLLFEEKLSDQWNIGQSIAYLRKKNPLIKFGLYVSDFNDLSPSDCVFLQLCRSQCDLLILATPSDYSLRLQGKESKFPTAERVFRLGSLVSVNYIIVYDEEICNMAVDMIQPDFIFYGRTINDEATYVNLINKDKLTFVEYPWKNEVSEFKWFKI